MPEDDTEDEWKFSVDEFDDSPSSAADSSSDRSATDPESSGAMAPAGTETAGTDDEDTGRGENDDANVAGEFAPESPVVPQMPQLENAVFVTLGAILTILVFYAAIPGVAFGPREVALVVVIVGGFGALAYGALVRLTPDT